MPKSKPDKVTDLLLKIRNCIDCGNYYDTLHAIERKFERKITLPEILYVLKNGRHEKIKDHFEDNFNTWNYAIRGHTLDGDDLRVIVSFDQEKNLLIITAFYLNS